MLRCFFDVGGDGDDDADDDDHDIVVFSKVVTMFR